MTPAFPEVIPVTPVIDPKVRGYCALSYPGHKKGCPNFNNTKYAHRCPPGAPLFHQRFDLSKPVFAIVNEYNLAARMAELAALPRKDGSPWSEANLRCVLYWQPTARKQLQEKIDLVLRSGLLAGYEVTDCPEGGGVNVTATLAAVGIHLEWPPRVIVRQVAMLAVPLQK